MRTRIAIAIVRDRHLGAGTLIGGVIVLTTLARDLPIRGGSRTPLLPFLLQGLPRNVPGLVVALPKPSGAEIDTKANGDNEDNDRGALEDRQRWVSTLKRRRREEIRDDATAQTVVIKSARKEKIRIQ